MIILSIFSFYFLFSISHRSSWNIGRNTNCILWRRSRSITGLHRTWWSPTRCKSQILLLLLISKWKCKWKTKNKKLLEICKADKIQHSAGYNVWMDFDFDFIFTHHPVVLWLCCLSMVSGLYNIYWDNSWIISDFCVEAKKSSYFYHSIEWWKNVSVLNSIVLKSKQSFSLHRMHT